MSQSASIPMSASAIRLVVVLASLPLGVVAGKSKKLSTKNTISLPIPWIVASDWDDTIKAGGHGALFGIRGIGKRVEGTYPGMTTLLAELDPCWCGREVLTSAHTFQIWSAKPFGSKKQNSCSPPLHRKPVTRHGKLMAGRAWVASNRMPECPPRAWCRKQAAKALGRAKFGTFISEAQHCGDESTEVLFFGDSAQGDAYAASLMIDCPKNGQRAFCLLHDLTRGTTSAEAPCHEDVRIAVKTPFESCRAGWRCPRVMYYKTVPEAAFMLAQLGFLRRPNLQYVVETTRREMDTIVVQRDEMALERLRRKGQEEPLAYDALVYSDLKKCEALLRSDKFWRPPPRMRDEGERRALATDEVALREVKSVVRRSAAAHERAKRSAGFREAARNAKIEGRSKSV